MQCGERRNGIQDSSEGTPFVGLVPFVANGSQIDRDQRAPWTVHNICGSRANI